MELGGVRMAMTVAEARCKTMLVLVMLLPKQTIEKLGHFGGILKRQVSGW